MNRRILTLPDELSNAVREYYIAHRGVHNDKDYQAKFAATGARKAQPVLAYVRERFPDLARLVYVSIGGADGSEVAAVLQRSPISHGVLLEFSDEGAAQARVHSLNLSRRGKQLVVLQGDATQRLEDCCERLRQLHRKGITGIVCSAQAVLHELPFRSPTFRLSYFFGRLFHGFGIRFFYSREPAALSSWPETVQLRFGGTSPISSAVVAGMARLIIDHFHLPGEIYEVVDNYVELSRAAAGEVLRKILYFADQSHFVYEMGECHERFEPEEAARVIGASVGNCPLEVQRLNSKTFSLRYDQFQVEARHPNGNVLQKPAAFALLRGFTAPTVFAIGSGETPRPLSPGRSGTPFVREAFDGDITRDDAQRFSSFRSEPNTLTQVQARKMLKERGLFESCWNKLSKGIAHIYELEKRGHVVYDRSTKLMWQQSGSQKRMSHSDAEGYIKNINKERSGGFCDWRLPTLEEAMTLMEPDQKNGDLHIDPVFDGIQRWIWTADQSSGDTAWFVHFLDGICSRARTNDSSYFVRTVRSLEEADPG